MCSTTGREVESGAPGDSLANLMRGPDHRAQTEGSSAEGVIPHCTVRNAATKGLLTSALLHPNRQKRCRQMPAGGGGGAVRAPRAHRRTAAELVAAPSHVPQRLSERGVGPFSTTPKDKGRPNDGQWDWREGVSGQAAPTQWGVLCG